MVELVSSSSSSDEQTFFSQACEIFRLELPGEVVSCKFACAQVGELMDEFEFLPAELGHIGAELAELKRLASAVQLRPWPPSFQRT